MELRHLAHFLAVAEERSFTRASQRLHLVQSTLSVSIRALERELGGRLFDRTTHPVALTDAGRALLPEARTALAAVDAARDAVAAAHGGLRGTVHVGIMHSLSLIDLAGLLTRYHQERPQVRIVPGTALGGSAELAAKVADGTLDLAFAALPGDYPSGLTVRPLASEPLLLACPQSHPLARQELIPLTELDGGRFVDFPVGWGTRASVDQVFLRAGLRREIAVEVTDIPMVVDLVRAGFGCAFLSGSLISASGADNLALRPVHPEPRFEVSLITSAHRRYSAAARAFLDLVLAGHAE
ncbi:LysR family transcriptional regulator [Streptomyces spongiae]|uniref:LysR family transcriptional regulator n=1 Tax=Streptomyces spongiae TaxID=565072 RepID=A0A5N8X8R5_9ACTN|nr:LysR family transcriptional regulator [Streptomyces spongiae]MPY55890.1 LysR family transcriptional regulator [Streptomyces spongiae]